jgi:hypothetical protein
MKKVAVIGANGNMGKRYAMILEQFTACEVVKVDIGTHKNIDEFTTCDGFIVATPTETHLNVIKFLGPFRKPILCEKPITKDIDQLEILINDYDIDLSMINQYHFLEDRMGPIPGVLPTWYNYFKTGNDGLLWDCINIIGTARGPYSIKNDSLVWDCQINGWPIDLRDMDEAYIWNITDWVKGWRNKEYILPTHLKVLEAINAKEK